MSASRRPPLRSAWIVALTVVLAATVCLRAPALAALDKREVEARKDFAAGRYEQAADLFAELFAQNGDPIYLRNLGRCFQKLKRPQEAINNFQEYLSKAPNLSAAERDQIAGFIKEMQDLLASQTPSAPATPVATVPAPAEPGPTVTPAPTPAPAATVATTPSPPAEVGVAGPRFRTAAYVTAGAGVALVGVGIGFGLAARSDGSSVSHFYDPGTADTGKRDQTLQWVGYGLGAAAIATGAILYVYGASAGDSAPVHVSAALGNGAGGLLVGGRF